VSVAASQRRCPGLLVWGKLIRLCQHPNKASKIFTISSWLLHQAIALTASTSTWVFRIIRPAGPETSVTVSSGFCLDFVSLDFHIPMTQFVISLYYEHRFQYVERRYSGFVALSFVVAADAGLDHLRNQRVKSPKEFDPGWRSAGNRNASDSAKPAD
jgi:hypothetical protein